MTFSCNDSFLEEKPKDFLSLENAYSDVAEFEAAITGLHSKARDFYSETDGADYFVLPGLGTDLAVHGENLINGQRMDYSSLSATDGISLIFWKKSYLMISYANTIINHADSKEIIWSYDNQKNEIVAEARFFRAWAYRILANLYGGVPIVEDEVRSAKKDFVRASRAEVYQFARTDLEFAAANLPDTEKSPGRITKAAANHLLSEICLAQNDWQAAIDAASKVINNPNYELMKSRFGTRVNVEGDVFWDLFQIGNQNRSSGNKEAIWVIQNEYGIQGGTPSTNTPGYGLERAWGARYFDIKDFDGKAGFIVDDANGRPVGWCVGTNYLQQTIWQSDWNNDMRNSKYNIKREFYFNNPASKYYGQKATKELLASQPIRYYHPYFQKVTTPNNHPGGVFTTGRIWRDLYVMRLAETYLLRAEAYLGKGDKVNAAADINVVRSRANASPVAAENVNIDYILDERARELVTEEFRTCTLCRLGLLYDRTKKYSQILQGDGTITPSNASVTIKPYNNLWPIPQTEIDLNTDVKIEQNPGY